jgi:hypothetical protein
MTTAYFIVAGITVAINLLMAAADYAHAPFVLANSAEVAVPSSWLPWLATCKTAGALGIVIGLVLDTQGLVLAATIGLTAFYLGAILFHLRARVLYNLAFPALYLATAAATCVLAITAVP